MTLEEQESKLGTALALIHRALPKLDQASQTVEVQRLLGRASALLESVRVGLSAEGSMRLNDPELAAVIGAAVAVMFDQPHRVLSVEKIQLAAPQSNVWAYEGRSEIFHSHKVR